jgi:curli biogenesis system outer membrane secretion channel CsgG
MKRPLIALFGLALCAGQALAAEKPVMAVAEFKNESGAGWWHGGVGWDLAGLLSNELVATGDFSVVERDKLQNVMEEQNLMASGRAEASDAAKMGKLTGARYLVMGTVSSYEEGTKSDGGGLSFGGISVGGKSAQAYVAIDIRVVDTTTGRIEYVRTIEGTSKSSGSRLGLSKWGVGGNFESEKNTPAGKAVRSAVIMIADYLDCVMVKQDPSCKAKFDAAEQRRREKTAGTLDID